MSDPVEVADPAGTEGSPDSTTTSTRGEEARFGGLTPREASARAAQARAARREQEEGTTPQKIARAFDRLSQADWDRAVKGALGSASGMQALTRLLDRVASTGETEAEEEGTLSPAERQAALDALRALSQGRGEGEASSSTSASAASPQEQAGGDG